jgi:hypothetical protein
MENYKTFKHTLVKFREKRLLSLLWRSVELALVIVFAALGLAYTIIVAQMGYFITGIQGANFLFIIGYVIFISSQFLLFKGKKLRYFVSTVLFVLLITPTNFAGAPFDIIARIPIIIHAFFADLFFNSVYGFFERHNKLFWWTILLSVEYNVVTPVLSILFYSFFYPPEFVETFTSAVLFMFPVIIIESIAGGYLGYKVYSKVEKLL